MSLIPIIEPNLILRHALRPENIALSKTPAQSSIRNSLQGRVTEVWMLGALVRVKVDCGVLLNALITRRSVEEMVFFLEFWSTPSLRQVLSLCSGKR